MVERRNQGPYEMLVKERMMGIYLAVFVHKNAKHVVLGELHLILVSIAFDRRKDVDVVYLGRLSGHRHVNVGAVTAAGLIGGRVGAVGISMNISGTTILIINAHLAGASAPHHPPLHAVFLNFLFW